MAGHGSSGRDEIKSLALIVSLTAVPHTTAQSRYTRAGKQELHFLGLPSLHFQSLSNTAKEFYIPFSAAMDLFSPGQHRLACFPTVSAVCRHLQTNGHFSPVPHLECPQPHTSPFFVRSGSQTWHFCVSAHFLCIVKPRSRLPDLMRTFSRKVSLPHPITTFSSTKQRLHTT
jgi:hypothetical protein